MSEIISMINMKGGVGKTTLTVNLAYSLSVEFNKKVLIVDMDPQFNATQLLFTKFKDIDEYKAIRQKSETIAGVLVANGSFVSQENTHNIDDVIIQIDKNSSLFLVPGDLRLTDFESSTRGSERRLEMALSKIKDQYDFIFIDTPATYSVYSQAALLASDYYLVPLMPDLFATLGYSLLKSKMKKDPVLTGKNIANLGVIINLWDEHYVGRQNIVDEVPIEETFTHKIKNYEVNRSGKARTLMVERSRDKQDIIDLTKELIQHIDEIK